MLFYNGVIEEKISALNHNLFSKSINQQTHEHSYFHNVGKILTGYSLIYKIQFQQVYLEIYSYFWLHL